MVKDGGLCDTSSGDSVGHSVSPVVSHRCDSMVMGGGLCDTSNGDSRGHSVGPLVGQRVYSTPVLESYRGFVFKVKCQMSWVRVRVTH